jgi:hypothetical protein
MVAVVPNTTFVPLSDTLVNRGKNIDEVIAVEASVAMRTAPEPPDS